VRGGAGDAGVLAGPSGPGVFGTGGAPAGLGSERGIWRLEEAAYVRDNRLELR